MSANITMTISPARNTEYGAEQAIHKAQPDRADHAGEAARHDRAGNHRQDEYQQERERLLAHRRNVDPREKARDRPRIGDRQHEAQHPRREREHFANDPAHEREQRGQRYDGNDGEIESVHRRCSRAGRLRATASDVVTATT
jgi:hypothetical protein